MLSVNQNLRDLVIIPYFSRFSIFHDFAETFYIKSFTGDAIKAFDKETFEAVLEEPKPCRWRDPGKYFRWSGEMLINDEGNYLTLEMSDLHEKGHIQNYI